jgi:methionyl aminopeptidase
MIFLKTNDEIELLRESNLLVGKTLAELAKVIKPGVTTKDLDKLAEEFIRDNGAVPTFKGFPNHNGNPFPASICTSVNEQVVHGIPGNRVIKEGEIVSVDVGACINGFHGDGARSLYVGKISAEKKRLIDVTKESFFKGIEGVLIGSPLGDIGYQIQNYVEAQGFSVVRDMVGHGIGREVHEDPQVPNFGRKGTGIRLKKNMTLAIEPMVNMGTYKVNLNGWDCITSDKMPSAHYENTVVITDNGVEILTL